MPVKEGILTGQGSFRFIESDSGKEEILQSFVSEEPRKGGSQNWVIPLVRRLVGEGKQVIVFREQTGQVRGTANYLAERLDLPPATKTIAKLPSGDPSLVSEILKGTLSKGIALHSSRIRREERLVIEESFRQKESEIRVIVATTTLAMGVNTPAESVVIVGLEHPGPKGQKTPYSVAEYKNMVGRAGRLGFSDFGESYLLALEPREELENWERYVVGEPEALESRFLHENTDPRSLIVRVLVSAKKSVGDLKERELYTKLP